MTTIVATLVLWVTSSSPSAMINRAARKFGVQSQQWQQWRVSFRTPIRTAPISSCGDQLNDLPSTPDITMTRPVNADNLTQNYAGVACKNLTQPWLLFGQSNSAGSQTAEEKCHSAADTVVAAPWAVEEDSGQETHTCTHTRPTSISSQ